MEAGKPHNKILIVDDSPANLLALQAVFSGESYKLIEAASGEEALSQLHLHPDIAVILLDVQMPGMDGFETANQIKQINAFRDIPIIFITAIFHEDPFIKQGYQAGAIDYFSKPFDPDILKMKVGIYATLKEKQSLLRERELRVRQTEELLKAGRKLSAILETLPVGVLISDAEGKIVQTNEVVTHILGNEHIDEDDRYGEVLDWWDHEGNLFKEKGSPLANALNGQSSHNRLIDLICCDGIKKSILVSASPLKTPSGMVKGAVVVIQDVTESKKIEEDLEGRILSLISIGVEFTHQENLKHL